MAFNLWKALGIEKKGAPDYSALTNAVRPFQSLTQIPVGATLNQTILDALQKGKGIGFGPEYTDKTTSPLVTTREARWKQSELPSLESSLGSRGLSRSTLGARDIGIASANKENDINSIIANAYKENEQQKKADQTRYENLGYNWTGAEAAQQGAYANEDARRAGISASAENQYRTDKEAERVADLNKTIGLGLKAAGVVFPQLSPLTTAMGTGFDTPDTSLAAELEKFRKLSEAERAQTPVSKASPFVTMKAPNFQGAYDYFKNM